MGDTSESLRASVERHLPICEAFMDQYDRVVAAARELVDAANHSDHVYNADGSDSDACDICAAVLALDRALNPTKPQVNPTTGDGE